MSGKHRKTSRPAAVVAMVVAPAGLAAAAMAATSITGGAPSEKAPVAAPSPSVDLQALITPANSTAQIFAGASYYGVDYTNAGYGAQQTVPFYEGPTGIASAIHDANDGKGPNQTVVLASGWGAGQTGTALGQLKAAKDPALNDIKLVILDNNTNRAGGGFWTTYAPFAPLLGTSAAPTPSDTGVPTLDVAYEYNINSDAPVDPLNPFALGNSLAAYAFDYGAQSTAVIPKPILDEAQSTDPKTQHYAYVLDKDGNLAKDADGNTIKPVKVSGTTTYVTIQEDNLPLTRPLRLIPGGDILADAIDPTMTELVNAGYDDGKGIPGSEAIPEDPTITRPMQPGSSLGALGDVPGTIPAGVDAGVDTAKDDVSDPGNFVTKPIDEIKKLPGINSIVGSTQSPNSLNKPNNGGATSSTTHPRPLKKIADDVKTSLNKLADGAKKTQGSE